MTKGQRIDFFREIKKSLNRYLSILFIVALGVAFYTGIRSSEPDMKQTADAYLDGQDFMDVRILGTLGLTEDDRKAIEEVRGVEAAEGIYSSDMLLQVEGTEKVLNVVSVPEDIGQMYVTEGRLPLKSGECLLDERFAKDNGYRIGDSLTLYSGTEEDILETLAADVYTVVGVGKNPYYLTWERGNSSIGNGSLAGFMAIQKADFKLEAYTQIYVKSEGAEEFLCFSDEYEAWIDRLQESIEAIAGGRCGVRYEDVVVAGWEEVDRAKAELADAREQLDAGRAELNTSREQLDAGRAEYDSGMAEYESAMAEIAAREQELTDGKAALDAGRQELERQEDAFEEARIQVVVMETVLSTAQATYERNLQLYYELIGKLSIPGIETPEDLEGWLEENGVNPELWQGLDIEGMLEAFKGQLDASKAEIDRNVAQVASARAQLNAASNRLTEAKVQIQTSELQLEDGEKQLADAKLQMSDVEHQLANAKAELDAGVARWEEGERELEEAEAQFEKENAEALLQIEDAEKRLNKLSYPEWYVLDRGTIQTYVEFGQDAESVGKLAEVFPVIFFLVAALVSLTTMTRMVEEERLQIGTMKALGYGKGAIASKYVLYALSASLIGSLLGIAIGGTALPFVVITAYKIMYENVVGMQIPFHMEYSLTAAGMAIGCTVAATLFACYRELLATPAALMRPEAPKQGRRVLLERIGLIWKHLSFSMKSTIRNLLRYKKRFFMTIFGIGACMALLLVGFGLRDSIMVIVDNQYQTIWVYDMEVSVDTDASEEEKEALERYLADTEAIVGSLDTASVSMDFESAGIARAGSLIVPKDTEAFSDYTHLRNMETQEPLSLDEDGVILTEKLARILEAETGDTVYLKISDTEEYAVKVLGVTEHYMRHIVYMSPDAYEKILGEAPEYNQKEILLTEDAEAIKEEISAALLSLDAVQNISLTSGLHEQVESMLGSLDLVIWVLILSAGLLAFVVLYNLNNINITERRRELATLKVLGFYDIEVAVYVYRENIFLTLFGMAAGVFLGNWLHLYVVTTVEIDMLLFGRQISTISYVYGLLLTALFSVIVNVSMYYKLKKIDMVESLKSVE
ncbi:MAG: ABC transporter permease [Lachnospiraceae bacterium]|nr:ABC transporter permease [Lachnospiraceae bacterium]